MLKISDFPQLRLIAWNLRHTDTIEEADAFSLYERNWRFVDQAQLSASEKALIECLSKKFGQRVIIPRRHFQPNAETRAAFAELERGGLKQFDSVESLLADLNAED